MKFPKSRGGQRPFGLFPKKHPNWVNGHPLFGLLWDRDGQWTQGGLLPEQAIWGGLYFALGWMHVGGFMALAGEMAALISHVRLRVSAPLSVVSSLSLLDGPKLWAFFLKMLFSWAQLYQQTDNLDSLLCNTTWSSFSMFESDGIHHACRTFCLFLSSRGALIFTKEWAPKIFTSHSFELLSNFHFVRKRKFHQNKLWRYTKLAE